MNERDAIEALAVLLDGEASADAVPGSLTALATLADSVRDHAELLTPDPAFRASLRAELVAAGDAPPGLVERARATWDTRTAGLRASARVAIATMTASSMIGTAGVAAAAQSALPGQSLYGLKGLTEEVRLLLATDEVAEARLHLTFARERLEELRATAGQLSDDQVAALLTAMDRHSQAGADVLLDGVTIGAVDPAELRSFTHRQRDGLIRMINDLSLLTRPLAEDSLELLRRIEITAAGTPGTNDAVRCVACGASRSAPAEEAVALQRSPRVALPGEGPLYDPTCDCVDVPVELREVVEQPREEPSSGSSSSSEAPREEQAEPPADSQPQPEPDESDKQGLTPGEHTLGGATSLGQLPVGEGTEASEPLTTDEVVEQTIDGLLD